MTLPQCDICGFWHVGECPVTAYKREHQPRAPFTMLGIHANRECERCGHPGEVYVVRDRNDLMWGWCVTCWRILAAGK